MRHLFQGFMWLKYIKINEWHKNPLAQFQFRSLAIQLSYQMLSSKRTMIETFYTHTHTQRVCKPISNKNETKLFPAGNWCRPVLLKQCMWKIVRWQTINIPTILMSLSQQLWIINFWEPLTQWHSRPESTQTLLRQPQI